MKKCGTVNKGLDNHVFCRKLFHVRPVTQGDVIRADGKDIPRIFQVCFLLKILPNWNELIYNFMNC